MSEYCFQVTIKKSQCDLLGHVNNAAYLKIYEKARWDMLAANGYGVDTVEKLGKGPVILEAKVKYIKEIFAGEKILVKTQIPAPIKKITRIKQAIYRGAELCSTVEIKWAYFDLKKRKIMIPTKAWLKGLGQL